MLAVLLAAATARADREAELRETIAHASEADARARALDELGRLQEARGDRLAAQTSYVESLRAAGDPAVRARLARIDRDLAESFDPFTPSQLRGPFASLEAFGDGDEAAGHKCAHVEVVREIPRRTLHAPIRRAVIFEHGCEAESVFVGIELADGWYLSELVGVPPDDGSRCGHMPVGSAIGLARVAVRGDRARIRVDYQIDTECDKNGDNTVWGTIETDHVVVGIGSSGVPSATAPITSARRNWHATYLETGGQSKRKLDPIQTLPVAWHSDGSFTIARPRSGTIDPDLVGRHVPRFP